MVGVVGVWGESPRHMRYAGITGFPSLQVPIVPRPPCPQSDLTSGLSPSLRNVPLASSPSLGILRLELSTVARKIPQKCEEGGGILSEGRPLSYIMASGSPSLPTSPLGEGWMKAAECSLPQAPMPQPPQEVRGMKLSSQGTEKDLGYVQETPGSGFPLCDLPGPQCIQTQEPLLCLWCGRFILTDVSPPRALEERGDGTVGKLRKRNQVQLWEEFG